MIRTTLTMVAMLLLSTGRAQDIPSEPDDSPTQAPQTNCAEFQSTVALSDELTMSYVVTLDEEDETNGQIAVQLVCECQAWVSLAVSEDLFMPDSDAIVGLPLENEVAKYRIGSAKFMSESDRLPEEEQTLSNTKVMYNDTHTVMEFEKRLFEPNEIPINGSGPNTFLWAFGFDLPLGIHRGTDRGVFSLSLSPCIQGEGVVDGSGGITQIETKTYQAHWSAHGLLASVAWGILAPCAVGSSLLRDIIPGQGIWFKIHMMLNAAVLIFTVIALSLAVSVISKSEDDPQHFQGEIHRSVGLAIFLLVIIQVFGGLFRPDAPHKDDDGVMEEKKPIRFVWEVMHKGSGYGLLGLSLWEVHNGIKLYSVRFGTDYLPVFWGITGGIVGFVLVLWIFVLARGRHTEHAPGRERKEIQEDTQESQKEAENEE